MGWWSTVTDIAQGVGAVASLFGGDEPSGPNPKVATWNFVQQRTNAAETIRQLGWQGWMSGLQAEHTFAGLPILGDQALLQEQTGDWMEGHAANLHAKADMLGGVYDRERLRRYGAVNAAYERTAAYTTADVKAAKASASAAQAAAGAAITRAEVAIKRAVIGHKLEMGALKLGQAQAGLRSSSYQVTQGAHLDQMLALTVSEQEAVKSAAGARAAAAGVHAQTAEDRAAATMEFALGEHGRQMGAAADWFTQAESGRTDMRHQATQWGLKAAGADVGARQTRHGAAGQALQGIGQTIQADFFQTQAQIGSWFLQNQPGVEEYGGSPDLFPDTGPNTANTPPRSGFRIEDRGQQRGTSRTPARASPGPLQRATSRTPARGAAA